MCEENESAAAEYLLTVRECSRLHQGTAAGIVQDL